MPVPWLRSPVCTAFAAGVASSRSAVLTRPSEVPFMRCRYSAMYSMRGAKNTLVTCAGFTPSWPFAVWLPLA